MSAAKKRPARKTPKSRKPVDKPRELARKARLPHVYTRSEMHEIMQDLRDRDKSTASS